MSISFYRTVVVSWDYGVSSQCLSTDCHINSIDPEHQRSRFVSRLWCLLHVAWHLMMMMTDVCLIIGMKRLIQTGYHSVIFTNQSTFSDMWSLSCQPQWLPRNTSFYPCYNSPLASHLKQKIPAFIKNLCSSHIIYFCCFKSFNLIFLIKLSIFVFVVLFP